MPVALGMPVVPPLHLFQIFQNLFISLESDCFDEKNGFRQFSESFKKFLWSPFVDPRVTVCI